MSRPGDAFAGYLRNPAFGGGASGPAAQHLGRMGRFSGPGLLSAGRGAFRLHRHFPYPERPSRAAKDLWAGHPQTLPAIHPCVASDPDGRSEEHTSELQSLMRISYAVFCLKKKTQMIKTHAISR